MSNVSVNPEPLSRNDAELCTCQHENPTVLILYKTDDPNELVCKSCYSDPDLFKKLDIDIDIVFDMETGEILQ